MLPGLIEKRSCPTHCWRPCGSEFLRCARCGHVVLRSALPETRVGSARGARQAEDRGPKKERQNRDVQAVKRRDMPMPKTLYAGDAARPNQPEVPTQSTTLLRHLSAEVAV